MKTFLKSMGIAVAILIGIGVLAFAAREAGIMDLGAPNVAAEPAETPGPNTIPPGSWTVGKDIQPGSYTVTKALADGSGCYWAIYKAGTNQNEIINNDTNVVGRPTVVLEAGHEFRSHDCGTWEKVK